MILEEKAMGKGSSEEDQKAKLFDIMTE